MHEFTKNEAPISLVSDIIFHAVNEYPNEACGLVVKGEYVECFNIADTPRDTFVIAPADWQPADIIVHSHTNGLRYLSDADRAAQHQSGLDWWLVVLRKVGDKLKRDFIKYPYIPLLRGRTFEYGVNDCCTMITDSYRLCGIVLKDYERDSEQADIDSRKIINSLADTGFYQVSLDDLQAGDVILTSIRGEANHASIYLGDEKVLHHPYGGLSRVEGMGSFWHKNVHSVWRHKDWRAEMITAINNDLQANNH